MMAKCLFLGEIPLISYIHQIKYIGGVMKDGE